MSQVSIGNGVGSGGELTSSEELFIQNIAGLSYTTGDILYYNGSSLARLGIGSTNQVLSVSLGIPSWMTIPTSGTISGATITVLDSAFTIQDNIDPSRQMMFQLSGITAGQTRTVTLPDASGTMTLLGNASTGSGSVALATSPTFVTPTLGVAAATSINFGGGALSTYIPWTTYTPTVTMVGGSDTVPVYSTNTGRYTQIGSTVFVEVYLTGDGGNEGLGSTSQMNIAIPVTAGANQPTYYVPIGFMLNLAAYSILSGQIAGSGTTIALSRNQASARQNIIGDDQNNTTRTIRISFFYEV